MPNYIHELPNWPKFEWDQHGLATQLAAVRHRQGRLIGRMQGLGFPLREEAVLRSAGYGSLSLTGRAVSTISSTLPTSSADGRASPLIRPRCRIAFALAALTRPWQ
jgi:Domain of unknown function (DUF4172)